jgi:hypothetical protein
MLARGQRGRRRHVRERRDSAADLESWRDEEGCEEEEEEDDDDDDVPVTTRLRGQHKKHPPEQPAGRARQAK